MFRPGMAGGVDRRGRQVRAVDPHWMLRTPPDFAAYAPPPLTDEYVHAVVPYTAEAAAAYSEYGGYEPVRTLPLQTTMAVRFARDPPFGDGPPPPPPPPGATGPYDLPPPALGQGLGADGTTCRPCQVAVAAPAPASVRAPRRGRRFSGRRSPSSVAAPTPQDLRQNPERLAKVKTEMCRYYEEGKKCPYGGQCNYAHGKHELRFKHTTLCLMESSGQIACATTHLARPCMTWVSTGACPFGRRCNAIHDPSVSAPLECLAWLPAAVAKTNAAVIVDRLGAHRDAVVHQENPLVAQGIWENCRPSPRDKIEGHIGQEWRDTYHLVCNLGTAAFVDDRARARLANSLPAKKVSNLQRLCIVRHMRSDPGLVVQKPSPAELHRDYVFAPTHSLHSELCMVLQVRCFLLPDVGFAHAGSVSAQDVVQEITLEEYRARTTPWSNSGLTGYGFDPSKCVMAHEVAFAPKGDHGANVSIWLDAHPVKLEQSQIKRSRKLKQKKKTQAQARNDCTRPHANGALISRTSSADFPSTRPAIEPFVPMVPAEDTDQAHALLEAILEHRIDSLILHKCSSVEDKQKGALSDRARELHRAFKSMLNFHETWLLPKREGMDHVAPSTRAPPGNIMPYIPTKGNEQSPSLQAWRTFAKSIGAVGASQDPSEDAKRLGVFQSFTGGKATSKGPSELPHIVGGWWKAGSASDSPEKHPETWKEILLGEPGEWKEALSLLQEKKKRSESTEGDIKMPQLPLSTIPFVQAS